MNTIEQELERNKKMTEQLKARLLHPFAKGSPQNLAATLKDALPPQMLPGNIGDLNNVFWPFYFTFTAPELPPNSGSIGSFTVTQEASFILLNISQVVFKKVAGSYTAINALNSDEALNNANNLNIAFRDAQSSRTFMQLPMGISEIGCAEFPTILNQPQMFLPNSTIECIYQNSNATETFVPFVTMFGYRLRVDNSASILSLITG
jgi:hypothetical protein